jgi:CubicO group peptidase (beta-lactamase class C family)
VSTPEKLSAQLDRLIGEEQRKKRLPAIAAAVLRDGELIWESAIGAADVEAGVDATPDTQFRVGSITKTFTAVAIMQLRDAGKLDLEDTLDMHVEGAAHKPSIRRLLSHASGLQRETQDDSWLTLRFAPADELFETFEKAEMVLPSGARFHYSNLAYALLGIVVERVSGMPYMDYVRERLFGPVGLTRVSFEPAPPAAKGYIGQPYADGVWSAVEVETGAWASAGQMWGTVGDLCRWGAFLADPDESVLAKKTAEEMRTVQVILDHERWLTGYGLGLILRRDRERILAGHTGSMPGFLATLWVDPAEDLAGIVLANVTSGPAIGTTAADLLAIVADREPEPPAEWVPAAPAPELLALTGPWYWGAAPVALRAHGADELVIGGLGGGGRGSRFRRGADGTWVGLDGYYAGETLRVVRGPDGAVSHLDLGSFVFTREPYAPADVVPGEVDPAGWR